MTTKELINQYVTAHADNRWMDASELEALLTEFAEKLQEPVSEDLEEASDEYIGYSEEIDEGITTYSRRKAFRDGALWYKNNHKLHWYKPTEYPDKGLTILCVYGTGYCDATEIVGGTQWDVMVEELNIVKWCYFKDILRLSE